MELLQVVTQILELYFLHLHEIVEGLYFHCSLSVCVSVCLSVCPVFSCEQNFSRTDEPIWTQFSLNGCFPHWLRLLNLKMSHRVNSLIWLRLFLVLNFYYLLKCLFSKVSILNPPRPSIWIMAGGVAKTKGSRSRVL